MQRIPLGINVASNNKLKRRCLQLICKSYHHSDMGRKSDLSVKEREHVTKALAIGKSTLQIAKDMQRDHRTIKTLVAASHHERKKRVQPKFRKLTERQLRQIHRQVVKTPLATSLQIFEACDMPKVCRATRCKALRKVASVKKAPKNLPLKQKHKSKRAEWAKKYMKVDFTQVIFTDECLATLDGPDGWVRGWVSLDHSPPVRMACQQAGGGVMFWAAIIGDTLIGPFRVEDGVKINATTYSAYLNKHFDLGGRSSHFDGGKLYCSCTIMLLPMLPDTRLLG